MATNLRTLARHLRPQPPPSKFTLRELFGVKKGSLSLRVRKSSFSVMTQNMALVTDPVPYLGTNRGAVVLEIIERIKALSPDVVGLCEVFSDSERLLIRTAVKDTYPSWIEGPDRGNLVADGGCLLLSKHPKLSGHAYDFPDATGGDIWSNKGVLHMRVQPPNSPRPFDLFYSHTQNIEAGSRAQEVLYGQIMQMGIFIHTHADANNPVFVMGDLNMPGEVPKHHGEMIKRLGDPVDLWLVSGQKPTDGLTFVSDNNFYEDKGDNPNLDRRLDYILMRAPKKFVPIVKSVEVLKFKLKGRDISDHFGLRAVFEQAVHATF